LFLVDLTSRLPYMEAREEWSRNFPLVASADDDPGYCRPAVGTTAAAIWRPGRGASREFDGSGRCNLPAPVAQAIFKKQTLWRAEKEVDAVRRIGCRILNWTEPEYPQSLLQIYDPPVLLYVRADASILNSASHRIVGGGQPFTARRWPNVWAGTWQNGAWPSSADWREAWMRSRTRGEFGGRGRAIGVLGTGIDVCYPKENRKLHEKILERGAIISELPTGSHPAPENFPVRNRNFAGMPLGVVIVEGKQYGGLLITARLAMEFGRKVLACRAT